jgi:EF hand
MKYLIVFVALASSAVLAQATKGIGSSIEGGPGMKPTASADQRINRLDKNKDGQISREEAGGHPKLLKGFDRIDVNKDGQLSRDELKAFHDKRKANRTQ